MWIDVPIVELITYFTQTITYFMDFAWQLGIIIGIFGIVWSSIQMAFGTMEIQKALVGTITKFFFFMFILAFYPTFCNVVINVSVGIGSEASQDTREKITTEFRDLLLKLEAIVDQENGDLAGDLAAAISAKTSIIAENSGGDLHSKYRGLSGLFKLQEVLSANDKVNKAEQASEDRKLNPSDNMKTVLAIKEVLKPIDKDGNVSDTSNAQYYLLDLTLKDKNGNDTGYLSPNAMLRISLLSAKIMWAKEWASVSGEWEEEAGFWSKLTKSLSIADFPIGRIFDLILTFVSMISIVLCMVFSLIQYVMAIVEFTIVISVGIVCIPCMLFDGLKDIAHKVLPAILAQAIKLTMITLCMFYAVWVFLDMALYTIGEGKGFDIETFAYVMLTILLALVLTLNAPKLAMALLNGQPQLSMGELVGVMASAAVAGNRGVAAAKAGVGAARNGVGAASRATMNRLGDASAIARAGSAASGKVGEMGGSKKEQSMARMQGMTGEAGYRVGQGLKSSFQGAAHHGMKGGGMGGAGGGGSAGDNRFGYNDDVTQGEHRTPGNSMKYGNAKDKDGRALTGKEFVTAQGDAAAARALANIKAPEGKTPPPEAKTHAKYPNTVAQSSYIGTDFVAPKMLPPPPKRKALPPPKKI